VPYKLFVGASKSKFGAEEIQKVFAEKNAKKNWRPTFDTWFTLVPQREVAEITVDVDEASFDQKTGYETVYFINGRLTIAGIVKDIAIRGDDTSPLFGTAHPEHDLLRRIIRFLRDDHKEAVLAHTAAAAPGMAPPAASSLAQPTAGNPGAAPTGAAPRGPEEDDPLYVAWSAFKPGSWVVRKSEGTLTDETKETLKSVAPEEVVVEVAVSGRPPRTKTIPAKRKVEGKGSWQESEEVIDVAGKPLRCHAQKTKEMSRWYCKDVPGGFAKFEWLKAGKYVQKTWTTAWEGKP
jgi:hypothetical protein